MPGVTAWYGLNKIIAPKAGETVLVSAATGAVGSVVGPARAGRGRARRRDRRRRRRNAPMPSTSSATPPASTTSRRASPQDLKAAVPNGVDGLFENVGGEPFQQALRRLNDFARVAICGLIASYEGAPTALPDMRIFLVRANQGRGLHRLGSLSLWPQAIERARRPCRRRPPQMAGDDPRRARKRAAGAGRSPARAELRQDADPGGLSRTQRRRGF